MLNLFYKSPYLLGELTARHVKYSFKRQAHLAIINGSSTLLKPDRNGNFMGSLHHNVLLHPTMELLRFAFLIFYNTLFGFGSLMRIQYSKRYINVVLQTEFKTMCLC